MTAYKQTLEAEGLPVYIVSHDWTTPEQVRDVLRKLYAENALRDAYSSATCPSP